MPNPAKCIFGVILFLPGSANIIRWSSDEIVRWSAQSQSNLMGGELSINCQRHLHVGPGMPDVVKPVSSRELLPSGGQLRGRGVSL